MVILLTFNFRDIWGLKYNFKLPWLHYAWQFADFNEGDRFPFNSAYARNNFMMAV